MPPAGFDLTISEGECPQTLDLDRAATGNGFAIGLKCDVTACGGKLMPVGSGAGGALCGLAAVSRRKQIIYRYS
jgi:hypothetical protein